MSNGAKRGVKLEPRIQALIDVLSARTFAACDIEEIWEYLARFVERA
jgi:hypothetical protein